MEQILNLLEYAGYKPEKEQSEFLQITRGIVWILNSIPGFTPTPVKFSESVTAKITISEAIAHDLEALHFPYPLEAHQIQGLDTTSLFPTVQWLVKTLLESRVKPSPGTEGSSRLEFSKFGKAIEVLELKSGGEIPTPQRNEIVVRVTAAPIHPSILGLIKGTYGHKPSLPAVPGNEGKVHYMRGLLLNKEMKARVSYIPSEKMSRNLPSSKEFVFQAQYIVLKKQDGGSFVDTPVLAVDDHMPDDFAAQFYVNPVAAHVMMFEVLNIEAGKWLIQSASGSTLGRIIIQLAKHKGVNLINLVRRAEQAEELKKDFGADTHVVAFDGTNHEEALKQISDITNNRGVNFAVDAVAGTTTELIVKALAPLGKVLVYGVLNGLDLKLNAGEMLFKEFSIQGFWLSQWIRRNSTETLQRVYSEVMSLMRQKIVTPFVEARYPFTEYVAAINHSMQKGKSGKVLLEWN